MPRKNYRNILVINTMHIGDLLLVTPVLRTLRSAYPEARLTLLTDRPLADLVRCNPCLDECLLIDKHGKDKGLAALVRFIGRVRAAHYDLVINLHRNERASAIAAFSGAGRIVGYSKPFFSLFFSQVLANYAMPGTPPEKTLHQVEAHFRVLEEAVGITREERDDRGIEMVVPPECEREAEELWARAFEGKPDAKVVAFNIGASWQTKRWIDTYFATCADAFIARGYEVAFFGGPTDTASVKACVGQMKERESDAVHVFTGRVSLGTLAGLLSRCVLFLTTDSGPMHVGTAMHLPIVTMFGPSPVPTFYPYDGRDVLVKTPEKCHPCGKHECPKKGEDFMGCMKHIPPEVVLRYASELLEKTGGKRAKDLPGAGGDYKCRVIEL